MLIVLTLSIDEPASRGDSRLDYAKRAARSAARIFASGKTEKALALFRKAAAFAPENPEYQNHVGVALITLGRLDEAQKVFTSAIEEVLISGRAARADLHYHRSLCRLILGDLPGALEDSRLAAELDPLSANGWRQLGLCHFRLADFRPALKSFEESLRREPESPFSLYHGAMTHFKLGNWRESLAMMDQAIKFAAPHDQCRFRKARETILRVFDPPREEESILRPRKLH